MRGIGQAGGETINKARYLEFKDIVPQWFEKLGKLLHENDSEIVDDILRNLYPEINSYHNCVLGEAYGFESSYFQSESKNRCQKCSNLSGNFSYYIRVYDKTKITETIDSFTKHWNEKHRYSLMKKDS
jgi:hypothetical protein